MSKPWMLDLCCCAGGATKGYQRAGFQVQGVDVVDRPRYIGDEFVKADAIQLLYDYIATGEIERFSFIHASWPCQAACTLVNGTHKAQGVVGKHPQLVPPGRDAMLATGLPWVIEQPSNHGGIIRTDLVLCADMFDMGPPPWIQRHRDFELNGFAVPQPEHPKGAVRGHRGYVRGYRGASKGKPGFFRDGPYVAAYGGGGGKATEKEMQYALGIDWTSVRDELTEAIPPAYTEYIGRAFLAAH